MMMASKSLIFRFADVEVREREFSLVRAGEVLAVEPKAFRVLIYLVEHAGHLVSKNELMDPVWGETAGQNLPLGGVKPGRGPFLA